MNCEKEEGIEGKFKQNNQTLLIIIIADVSAVLYILCMITFNLVLVFAVFLVLVIGAVILSNDTKSSYKADNETIIFMVGHFKKYNIKISDIRHINLQPYTAYERNTSNNYRVMLKIKTEEKNYKFNNALNVSKAVQNMLLKNYKPQIEDEALTRLYYYITDIRKDLYTENTWN